MDAEDGYFDERVAARYDESAAEMFDPAVVEPVVDVLVELAGSGRALELGIGTGRIALPLAQRGVPVHGIELSKAMVALIGYDPETDTFPSTVFSGFSPTPLPYRWDVRGDSVTITVAYGPLDATFTGTWREDGAFSGGWRPNPGADETVNVPYDIGGRRLA